MNSSKKIRLADILAAEARPEVAALISGVSKGVIAIAQAMRSSEALLGYSSQQNVQGETQADLDIFADKAMTEALFGSGVVAALVSEEQPELVLGGKADAPLVIAHDPLDGSSNIPFNIPVGTIFSAFRRKSLIAPAAAADYFQAGKEIVCAGYAVYGLRTQLIVTWGDGVLDCVFDEGAGEFLIRSRRLVAPSAGAIYSVNEGNSASWGAVYQQFIEGLKAEGGFSGRYVGSLVSDFDRNLRKGGLYLYPADKKNQRGKLRVLYECLPLALIAEQSGGASFDGERSLMDLIPAAIHERCPLFVGSKQLVQRLISAVHGGR